MAECTLDSHQVPAFRAAIQLMVKIQIKWACEADLPRGVVVIDAGYGVEAKFRSEISALNLKYVAGVKTTTTVWAPDTLAVSQLANSGRGRRPARTSHDAERTVKRREAGAGAAKEKLEINSLA